MVMEVCVDSITSATDAHLGGADRLELCSALSVGGLTPSLGLLKVVKKSINIPVFVLVRPRPGDFLYSRREVDVMKEDIVVLKTYGADGFVLGALNENGAVNEDVCKELRDACRPLPVTFHRAIDMTADPIAALDVIYALGFSRVLSSGAAASAQAGISALRAMVTRDSGVVVMPGGGITDRNLELILRETGATEFHCSAKRSLDSGMIFRRSAVAMGSASDSEYVSTVTDRGMVERMKQIAKAISTG